MSRSRSRSVGLRTPEPTPSSPRSSSRRSATPVLSPRVVVTAPPWARDETPSPTDDEMETPGRSLHTRSPSRHQHYHHPSEGSTNYFPTWDAASTDSNATERPGSRWWIFTRPRRTASTETAGLPMADVDLQPASGPSTDHPQPDSSALPPDDAKGKGPERLPMRERLKSTVLSAAESAERWRNRQRHGTGRQQTTDSDPQRMAIPEGSPDVPREHEIDNDNDAEPSSGTLTSTFASSSRTKPFGAENSLRLELPSTPQNVLTMAHSKTPGWQSPWVPHASTRSRRVNNLPDLSGVDEEENTRYTPSLSASEEHLTVWGRRRRKIRRFILHSDLTPLLLRLINLALTTSTLGIAIGERQLERHHHVQGVVGSSITLNIMFAPLTIVHVLLAIYLEYFGRPLGLWHTSSKLFHTLSETVFICLWSAALSITTDNYFTSGLRCAPLSSTRWWNQLPSPDNPLGVNVEGSLSDSLCSHTLSLIILVFFSLLTYILSLGVSLFRIFEKVKFHGANNSRVHV